MKKTKIVVFEGGLDEWFFRVVAKNGKIVAQSEGYTTKRNALKGIKAMQKCCKDSNIVFLEE